jgi:hypothetical protein
LCYIAAIIDPPACFIVAFVYVCSHFWASKQTLLVFLITFLLIANIYASGRMLLFMLLHDVDWQHQMNEYETEAFWSILRIITFIFIIIFYHYYHTFFYNFTRETFFQIFSCFFDYAVFLIIVTNFEQNARPIKESTLQQS